MTTETEIAGSTESAATTTDAQAPQSMMDAIFPSDSAEDASASPQDGAGDVAAADSADGADATQTAAESAQDAAAAKPDPAAEKAKADADALTPPKGVGSEAQKRFQHLAGMVKERDAKLAEATETVKQHAEKIETFKAVLQESGVGPQEFEQLLGFNRAMKTGDYARAEQWLAHQMKVVALARGRAPTTVDPLADFPDLAQAMAEGKITPEHAMELARGRVAMLAQRRTQQQAQQVNAQRAQMQKAQDAAIAQIDAFVAQVSATDLAWPQKEQALLQRIDWIAKNVHPSMWLEQVRQFYELVSAGGIVQPAQEVPAASANHPRPLRSASGAGGVKPAPASMSQAIDQALGFA